MYKCKSYCPIVDLREREGVPDMDVMALGMMHLGYGGFTQKVASPHPLVLEYVLRRIPMKYLVVGVFALSLLATAQFAFGEGRKVADVLKNPIEMKDASSSRMNVVFNHSSHKGINCLICHHMETIDGDVFVPCTNEECHATPARVNVIP